MSEQIPAGDKPDQDPWADTLDQSTELVGGKRRSGVAMGSLARGAVYGTAFVLVSGLSALAMFPELTRYAEPLLGAGTSSVSSCGQGACCQSKTSEAAAACDEDHCPASESPSTSEPEAAGAVAEATEPSAPADEATTEATTEQSGDASAPQIAADDTPSTDE